MKFAAGLIVGGMLATGCGAMVAQASGAAEQVEAQPLVSFQFERAGVSVPKYTLKVLEDGNGSYQADVLPGVAPAAGTPTEHVSRAIKLTPGMAAKIFKAARDLKYFNVQCEAKLKNVANTGTKMLSYVGPDGRGSCVYNYSENKNVTMLTDTFLGIAFTLDEARRLAFLHRFDRLGLDAEMDSLTEEAKAGRALELETIAPTLTSIANDTAVMERVRVRAEKLLELAKVQ